MLTFRGERRGRAAARCGGVAHGRAGSQHAARDHRCFDHRRPHAHRNGMLEVIETVAVPAEGNFTMSLPLRLKVGDDVERVFKVTDVTASGSGTATTVNDQFVVEAKPGESKFTYTVHNTVSDMPGTQVFHWLGVLNADIAVLDVSVISPSFQMGIVDCKLGSRATPSRAPMSTPSPTACCTCTRPTCARAMPSTSPCRCPPAPCPRMPMCAAAVRAPSPSPRPCSPRSAPCYWHWRA